MEEILASIRRIIEDSDAVRTSEETVMPPAANASSPTARVNSAEVDAFRDELREEAPAVVEPETFDTKEPVLAPRPLPALQQNEPAVAEVPRAAAPEPAVTAWTPAPSAPRQEPAVEVEAPKQSIISEVAGRQVAAAFGELS